MKRLKSSKKLIAVLSLLIMIVLGCHFSQETLPPDASSDCNLTITATEFNTWFQTGSVSLNGVVNPANSVTFVPNSLCSFYKWSEQMFLWLTSPAPKTYGGGGGLVLNSPSFYDVSPEDALGNRVFIPHKAGKMIAINVRTAQHGAHDLPVILEKKTLRLLEILNPVISKNGRQIILNGSGEELEVGNAKLDNNKKPVFFDIRGNEIKGAKALVQSTFDEKAKRINLNVLKSNDLDRTSLVQKFTINKSPVFLDLSGKVIDVEQGQAGGGAVLMAQNGSLVYYATIVNDVYAYFRTMQGAAVPSGTQFPTTQAQLNSVISFAASHGKTFVDPNAMAIEIKSSWVEADGLPDKDKFLQMQATVPTYDKTDPNNWVPNGEKTVTLAMVGTHVVGSTLGHPEMLWATFEHVSNTPVNDYNYTKSSGPNGSVPMSTTGTYVFCATGAVAPFNIAHMKVSPTGNGGIVSEGGFTISPSNTLRDMPFGMLGTEAASNSEIITINNSVRSFLIAGDLRGNYIQTGTTWTAGGASPSGGNEVGTNKLANSTMETYQFGTNCFDCHNTNTTIVSHVFNAIKPLF
jgi:hypothetical protein